MSILYCIWCFNKKEEEEEVFAQYFAENIKNYLIFSLNKKEKQKLFSRKKKLLFVIGGRRCHLFVYFSLSRIKCNPKKY